MGVLIVLILLVLRRRWCGVVVLLMVIGIISGWLDLWLLDVVWGGDLFG